MADAGILKEFLVALGFSVDETKLKRFEKGIDNATKMVGKFALGLEAMATAAEVAVVKVSTQFENLYYASQRLGDTVEDIRGFSFAMGQVGSTGKAGLQAMESIAEFLRSNPGGNRLFQAWGIDLKYVNGQAQVTSQTMEQLGATFRKMPYFQAKQYASVLGIDPNTLQAMLRGTSEAQGKASEIFRRMGVDQDKAALASKNFMNDFRELLLVLTVGLDKIVLAVQPTFDKITKGLEDLDAATGGWSTALIVLGGILLPLLTVVDPIVIAVAALAAGIVWVVSTFSDWRKGLGDVTGGLADIWDALQPVIHGIEWLANVIGKTLAPVLSTALNEGFHNLANVLHVIADVIRLVVDLLTGQWAQAWKDAGKTAGDALRFLKDDLATIVKLAEAAATGAKRAWDWAHGRGGSSSPTAAPVDPGLTADQQRKYGAATPFSIGGGPIGLRNNNPGNLRTGPVGVDGNRAFGKYATPLEGLTAMARNLQHYARQGINTVSAIINKWAPKSDHNDTEAYIRDVARQVGVAADQQLDLKDPATLTKLMGAITAHENGKNPYSSALMSQAASGALGRPVSVAQTTTIHVTGSDPQTTSKLVAGEQGRVNDALARNLKVAAS